MGERLLLYNPGLPFNVKILKLQAHRYGKFLFKGFAAICLFLFSVFSQKGFAQQADIEFLHITTRHGLSQNNVTCILQDKKGFIWFGTRDGLNRYDGYNFTTFRYDPNKEHSLSSSYINTLFEDKQGNLWVGSSGGLDRFNRENDEFTSFNYGKSPYYVKVIFQDKAGRMYLGTKTGFIQFDPSKKSYVEHTNSIDKNSLSNNDVNAIKEDIKGHLWIGTENGLNIFAPSHKGFTRIFHDDANQKSISGNSVKDICTDKFSRMWLATRDGGLSMYNFKLGFFTNFRHDPSKNSVVSDILISVAEGNDGKIWIGSEESGLSIYDYAANQFRTFQNDPNDSRTINEKYIRRIYKDHAGTMWLGTPSNGVNYVPKVGNKFTLHTFIPNKRNSLNNSSIRCMTEDSKGNLWIGTEGGINVIDHKSGNYRYYVHDDKNTNTISSNNLYCITQIGKDSMAFGYQKGSFDILDIRTNKVTHFKKDTSNLLALKDERINKIYVDRNRNVWIGTYESGLNLFDKKSRTFTHFLHDSKDASTICSNKVITITEDKEGNLWIGTDHGLDHFDQANKKFIHYKHNKNNSQSLRNDIVNCFFVDSKGNLWVGTNGGGLNLYNKTTNSFTAFTKAQGLPNDVIQGILEDNSGHLWLSTDKGLVKFNPQTKACVTFGLSDGLQDNEFKGEACLKRSTGEMLFGGFGGLNTFKPDSLITNSYVPPVTITGFKLFNKPVDTYGKGMPLSQPVNEAKEIVLSHKQTVFTIEFAALNYTNQEKNEYAYMLEGFDKDWNYVGSKREATYTNIDAGNYTFKVKGSNNDGIWNNVPATIKIIIQPPFWEKWWFELLCILLLAGCAVTLYKLRMNDIKLKNARLEVLVEERTQSLAKKTEEEKKAREEAELANKAKSVFLATMSHEIRTPMNGVIGMTSLLAETEMTDEQKRYTEIIRNSGDNLLTVINDILDFSKIESGKMELEQHPFDLRCTVEEVLDLFSGKAAELGLNLVYEMDYEVPDHIIGDCVRLRQILINLVGNAIKFTHKGEIFVGVKLSKQTDTNVEIAFEVRDTGIGISAEKQASLFNAFMQVDTSITRKYGGTGLGLAIAKRLVELMNGTIGIRSELAKGTSFLFTILSQPSKVEIVKTNEINLEDISGKRILIIDDIETNRRILKSQLEHLNLVPQLASSGKEALDILCKHPAFDIVITDMQMQEMDGVDLAKRIKILYPELPVILLSSIADSRIRQNKHLFCSVLTKPVKHQELAKIILKQFKHAEGPVEKAQSKQKLSVSFAVDFPLQILIAEDNPINQMLVVMVLKKLGYTPDTAEDGLKTLEALKNKPYDIVLMDVQMPEMDGLEASRIIRAQMKHQPIIVATTANAMQEDREICMAAGMDDYISKPIEIDILVQVLERWSKQLATRVQVP